jgi:hypothetical protein
MTTFLPETSSRHVSSSTQCLVPSVCSGFCFHSLLIFISDPSDRGIGPNMGYQSKVRVIDRYKVIGFISSGTYGRVYKAVGRHGQTGEFAIKKFKPGKPSQNLPISDNEN